MGRKLFWAMLAAALGAAFFTGCAQYRQQIKEMEKLAADRAQTHLWETYGGTAEILEVKVGTLQSGFHSVVDSDALVTVSLGEETFQVFVETAEPAFCRDNREGLALTRDLERYFRDLYRLPPALEGSVRVYCGGDFFAARPTHLAREYSFLNFDYHGQPVKAVLPLLDRVSFSFDYLDDTVSLERVELRDEDWGGDRKRVELDLRCFRTYRDDGEIAMGVADLDGRLVLLAEGMEFSRRGKEYGSLDDIAGALPGFVLRERLTVKAGEPQYTRRELVPMGDFWVSVPAELPAEDCFLFSSGVLDWTGGTVGIGNSRGLYYTREEIVEGTQPSKTTQKALLPFVDAQYRQEGELLLLKEGAEERMTALEAEKPSWDHSNLPAVQVMVRPSLVYEEKDPPGAGLLWQREGEEPRQVIQLFTSYQDQKSRWTHGLTSLTLDFPGPVKGLALVRVME